MTVSPQQQGGLGSGGLFGQQKTGLFATPASQQKGLGAGLQLGGGSGGLWTGGGLFGSLQTSQAGGVFTGQQTGGLFNHPMASGVAGGLGGLGGQTQVHFASLCHAALLRHASLDLLFVISFCSQLGGGLFNQETQQGGLGQGGLGTGIGGGLGGTGGLGGGLSMFTVVWRPFDWGT